MIQALIDMFIKIFTQFRAKFKRGDAFEEDFNTLEIVQDGVFVNPLEGEKAYTLFRLKKKCKEKKMKFMAMDDAYLDVARRDVKNLYLKNKWEY